MSINVFFNFSKNLFLCHYFSENGVKIIIFAYYITSIKTSQIRISCVSPMNNAKRKLFKFCLFAEPFDINNITNKIKKKYGNSSSIDNTCKKPFRR